MPAGCLLYVFWVAVHSALQEEMAPPKVFLLLLGCLWALSLLEYFLSLSGLGSEQAGQWGRWVGSMWVLCHVGRLQDRITIFSVGGLGHIAT